MADRVPGTTAVWLLLSDLGELGDLDLPRPHPLSYIFDDYPPYTQNAADIAAGIQGTYIPGDYEPKNISGERLQSWAQQMPAAGLVRLAAWVEEAEEEEDRKVLIKNIGLYGAFEVDEPETWRRFRRRECRRVLEGYLNENLLARENVPVLEALARCGWQLPMKELLASGKQMHRILVIKALAFQGESSHWPHLLDEMFKRKCFYRSKVVVTAKALLDRGEYDESLGPRVRDRMAGVFDQYYGLDDLKAFLQSWGPRFPEVHTALVRKMISHKDSPLRALGAELMGTFWPSNPVPHLARMVKENASDVRQAALRSLLRIDNLETCRLALDHLHSDRWLVRLRAVELLGRWYHPALLDRLLPMTRDHDEDVREAALKVVAPYKDRRVLGVMLASLLDMHEDVRKAAAEILDDQKRCLPSAPLHPRFRQTPGWYQREIDRVRKLFKWGETTGTRLTGKPTSIHAYRQGLGQTAANPRAPHVSISINVTPMLSGHPDGENLVRGLILHEIGHHLCDIGAPGQRTTWGIARSEGLGQLYAILMDERMERKMRSLNPDWGVHFDRLCSFAFHQEETRVPLETLAKLAKRSQGSLARAIAAGEFPGRVLEDGGAVGGRLVLLHPYEMAVYPGLQDSIMIFLVFLRCRMDLEHCPVPRVAEAVRRVPSNLKDLTHAGLLELCRELAALLGRDDEHKAAQRRMQRLLQRLRSELRGLQQALDRMAELGLDVDGTAPDVVYDGDLPAHARVIRPRASTRRTTRRARAFNQGPEQEFDELLKEERLAFQPDRHRALVTPLRKHIRQLQPYLEMLGKNWRVESGHRKGRRPDLGALTGAILRHSPNMFLREVPHIRSDCYIGILIDRSGSMEGEKLSRACSFAALVAESAKGVPGITGHINAFDDDTFVRLGDFRRHHIASLECLGGNNDAGALQRAADLAEASGRRHRLLIMISDGYPTGCSFASLENLVRHLTGHLGIVCAQVAVDELPAVAFPHFVDLKNFDFHEAVGRFGRLLMQLTRTWR